VLQQVATTHLRLPRLELEDGFVKGRISIIMPAFNEADCIAESIASTKKQFEKICEDFEIIVVDDGSTDGTDRVAEILDDDHVKVVSYRSNKGKGYALKEGFNFATGEFSFLVDSDLEIHATDLGAYLSALESADIVIGSKRHPLSVVETPVVRMFLSIGFNMLERLLIKVRVSDTQAGMKGARSTTLYKILPLLSVKKYAFDAELLTVATLLGFRLHELPVHIHLRAGFSARQAFRMLIDLLGISYRLRIKKWYQKNMRGISETYRPIITW
jgi:glycosyltransferase involved in cell wall biosynthesis